MAAGPVSASRGVDPLTSVDTCNAYIGDAQSGSLHMIGTPAPGTVPAGSDVSLAVSWADGLVRMATEAADALDHAHRSGI